MAVAPIDRGMAGIDDEVDPFAEAAALLQETWRMERAPALGSDSQMAAQIEAIETEPPADARAFARLVEQLRRAPLEELAVPVHNLAHSQASVWPELKAELLGERAGSKTQFTAILNLIGGDVPNRYGHFARSWKRNHGYSVKLSEDWFADLQRIPPGQISGPMRKVYRDALLTVALAHGAARIAREEPALAGEVVEALLDLAYLHGGTFRDEIGRAIHSIGDEAVPPLVRASVEPSVPRDDDPRRLRARYASYNLDRLDRLAPSSALAAASADARRLRELLDAYGEAKPGDAAGPILERVDHVDPEIRGAARRAFSAYVEGPPPRMRVKLVRRLGGVVERRQAQLSYRALATLAIRDRVAAELPEQLEEECEIRREDGSYDQRCLDQPKRLTKLLYAALDEERERERRTRLEAALAEASNEPEETESTIDAVLASADFGELGESLEDLRPTLRDFYIGRARSFEDPIEQASRLRKAASLARGKQADALRARALAFESRHAGVTELGAEMLRRRALEMDPSLASILDADASPHELAGTQIARSGAPTRSRFWLAWGLAMAVLGALAWLGGRRRRRERVGVSS